MRERIEAAVEAGGRHVKESYEGWIAADPFRGGIRLIITGQQGFERAVLFALDEDPAMITQRIRETIDEQHRRFARQRGGRAPFCVRTRRWPLVTKMKGQTNTTRRD